MRSSTILTIVATILLLAGCGGSAVDQGTTDTPGGTTRNTDGAFAIDSVRPARAPAGTTVTIHGGNFGANVKTVKVLFGGIEGELLAVAPDRIEVVVPQGAPEAADSLVVSIGKRPERRASFTVIPTPPLSVTSIAPASSRSGDSVTIGGTGFGPRAAWVRVRFGNRTAELVSLGDTAIVAIVPQGAASAPVTVGIGGKSITSDLRFTVLPPQYTMAMITVEGMTITLEETRSPDEPHTSTSTEPFGLTDSLGCSAAGCAHWSGDTMKLNIASTAGDMYTGTTSTQRTITIVLDTVNHRMRSVEYVASASAIGGGGTIGERNANGSDSYRMAALVDLPYTLLPDGSMVATLSGSAIDGHVAAMGRGGSSHSQPTIGTTFFRTTKTIGIAPYTPASRIMVIFR